jgi:hypothetical protein
MSYIGSAPSRNTPAYKQVYEFVATTAQTTFSVAYTVGFVEVYRNGVKLGAPNFTANNGTSVVLTSGANAGDFIQIISEFINPVLNAIPNTTGAVTTSNIASGVTVNFADGSASAPSITNDGDTNTGIFFPAADTIAFAEGGAEVARFDSSGNLLIGTTTTGSAGISLPSTYNVGWVQGSGESVPNIFRQTSSAATVLANGYRYSTTSNGFASSFSSSYAKSAISCGTVAGGITFYTDTAAAVAAGTDATPSERMRIASDGNVLIGTTSSTGAKFDVTQSINTAAASAFFDSRQATTSNQYGIVQRLLNDPNNTAQYIFQGLGGATERCTIRSNGGIANFSGNNVNLSDAREKTNVELAGSYLDKVCAIPVKTFNYIDQNREEDDGLTLGVIAQDVEAVAPELVMESNWGTQEEPKIRLSIYQTDLQYALMKCIQELKAEVDTVKAEVTALKGAE